MFTNGVLGLEEQTISYTDVILNVYLCCNDSSFITQHDFPSKMQVISKFSNDEPFDIMFIIFYYNSYPFKARFVSFFDTQMFVWSFPKFL